MLPNKASKAPLRRQRGGLRRGVPFAVAACALVLAACASDDTPVGTVGAVTGFAGIVAADEPHAALAARDVLSAGGTAADAVVAGAFTMAVTLPSSVGIGGGGVCLVHEPDVENRFRDKSTVEVLEFLPDPTPPAADRQGAGVPALPRGLFALHVKHGALRWESLLGPAERMARLGFPASRALSKEFVAGGAVLRGDMQAIRTFADAQGMSPGEGDTLVQENLGTTIARLRLRGVGDFYQGLMARDVVESYHRAGFALSPGALAAYRPRWLEPATVERGNEILAAPPEGVPGYESLLAYRAAGAAQQGGQPLPGGAGLLVVDNRGGAVACALTMNGAFGTGRMAPGTGMMIAAAPPRPDMSTLPLGVLMAFNPNVREFHFGAAGGGAAAGATVGKVAHLVLNEGRMPAEAIAETIGGRTDVSGLLAVAACPEGMASRVVGQCRVATDPRGSGYGMVVGRE